MKTAGVVLAIALALVLQTTLTRFIVRGTVAVDLVLVVVVYVALSSGSVTGLLAGTVAGLIQDSLSTGLIGIGGLAKTLVGFLSGHHRDAVHRGPAAAALRRIFRGDGAASGGDHRAGRAPGLAAVWHTRTPPSPDRRSATRSSAWRLFSSSSCCRERWSGADRKIAVAPVERGSAE